MILSDGEIEEALREGRIIIDPPPGEADFTTTAVDLHLGEQLFAFVSLAELQAREPQGVELSLVIDAGRVDVRQLTRQYTREIQPESDGGFLLRPNQFVLGATREKVELPVASQIAARVEGRSTLARLGLIVHLTAPTVHAGFAGNIVLEIYYLGPYPLKIAPGTAICQLILERVGRAPKGTDTSTYQHQRDMRG